MDNSKELNDYIQQMEFIKYNKAIQVKDYNQLIAQKDEEIRQLQGILNTKTGRIILKLSKFTKGFLKKKSKVQSDSVIEQSQDAQVEPMDDLQMEKISVVIPTKNGGQLFETLLRSLSSQICIPNIEFIVVDSGSEDNTLEVAKFFGAKLIEIAPKEFSHSYARNLGAKNATGEYLLFMTQDAIPTDELWLYKLLKACKNYEAVAASAMEIQKEFGDLKYKIDNFNHNNYIGMAAGDVIGALPENQSIETLRKNAQLADITCLVRRDIFEKYEYRGDFAEDLRLGLDIIKGGDKIALLASVPVVHGHERSASYYLKRNFVDVKTIKNIFEDYPIRNRSGEQLLNTILYGEAYTKYLMNELNKWTGNSLDDLYKEFENWMSVSCFEDRKEEFLANEKVKTEETFLSDLFTKIRNMYQSSITNQELMEELNAYILGGMKTYLYLKTPEDFEKLKVEICDTLYKTFCSNVGTYFAEYVVSPEQDSDIIKMTEAFGQGV